jgi:hypothetical protein
MTTTRGARGTCPSRRRGLIPPLTVALTATTALALLVLALTLAPLPTTRAQLASPPAWPLARPLPPAVTTTRLAQTMPLALPSGSVVLTLARLRWLPGSGGQSRTWPGPLLLVVEAGALTAELAGPALVVRADGRPTTASWLLLEPGDQLTLPGGTPAALRDAGTIPTMVVAAALMPAAISAGPGPPSLRTVAARSPCGTPPGCRGPRVNH